jgi:hypothetical protein
MNQLAIINLVFLKGPVQMTGIFYAVLSLLILAYLAYSWYWQANIDFAGRFRLANFIWAAIFIGFGFYAGLFADQTPLLAVLLALFLVSSLVDGQSGLAPHKLVISGYFRRAIPYREIEHVTLVTAPVEKPVVLAIFKTERHAYYLRFSKRAEDVITALKQHLEHGVSIEVQTMM